MDLQQATIESRCVPATKSLWEKVYQILGNFIKTDIFSKLLLCEISNLKIIKQICDI